MGQVQGRLLLDRGNLLSTSPVAAAVEQRARLVRCLLFQRRKAALAYKRTQDESDRLALERLDRELTAYRIDIPAVQESAGRSARARAGAGRPAPIE